MKKIINVLLIVAIIFNITLAPFVVAVNETTNETTNETENTSDTNTEDTDSEEDEESENETEIEDESEEVEEETETEESEEGISLTATQSTNTTATLKSSSSSTTTTQLIADGYYEIASAIDTNYVLDISGASLSSGANLQIYKRANVRQQYYKITYLGNGYYEICNVNSAYALDVANGSKTSGTNVQQYKCNSSNAQKWYIEDCEDGYYSLKSACNGLYLDVKSGKAANGTNVQVYTGNGSKAQKFKFVEVDTVMGEQTISDGYYEIASAIDTNYVLDISGASLSTGGNLQIYKRANVRQQYFKITYLGNGYYEICNVNSTYALDVVNGSTKSGANVQQYTSNSTKAQKWIIVKNSDGTYSFVNLAGLKYLDVKSGKAANGTNVQVYTGNGSKAQKFKFVEVDTIMGEKTVSNGYYMIATSLNSDKVLDISNASTSDKANLQIWKNENVRQQKFYIEYLGNGYYKIKNANSGKVLDVANGSTKSGANVQQYTWNSTSAQKWIIVKNSNGTYSFVNLAGLKYLDVKSGKTLNGTNVQVYNGNNSNAQKFTLTTTYTAEATKTISSGIYKIATCLNTGKVIDISGGSTSNGANAQIWSYANVTQQKFKITYLGNGYYSIKCIKSNKMLDVKNGSVYSGANVQQYTSNGTDAQKWIIASAGDGSYYIVSSLGDYFLDVAGGSTGNGTNLQVYAGNGTSSQKFKFTTVSAVEVEEGTYGSSGLKIKGDSRGTSLKYYKIGTGSNVLFATFAIHGWEDCYSYDGKALTAIAEAFKDYLLSAQDTSLASKWTIYIFPSVNPDGEYYGYSHNGPGRTTLYSAASSHQGIDMNRTWSTSWVKYTSTRNYNGTASFQAYEARYLRDFMLSNKSSSGKTYTVDLHGWLNETIGDSSLGSYYRSTFGMSTHISSYGSGYLVNWARSNLGNSSYSARSVLVEMPEVSSYSQVTSRNYATKYINATINMLKANS